MNHNSQNSLFFLWHRFGPYHYARFRAAAKNNRAFGIQFSGLDFTYAWKKETPKKNDNILTLFPNNDSQMIPSKIIYKKISSIFSIQKPSVVFIPGWSDKTALSALKWCLQENIPTVVMSPSQEIDAPRHWWKEWIKKRVVSLYNAGLAGGSPQKRYLQSLGISKNRILTGYNVIDNFYFDRETKKSKKTNVKLRKSLNLPEKYFVCSTRFVTKKNLDRLLQAYSIYLQSGLKKPWSLVILGDGPLLAELKALITQLNLNQNVLLPGFKQYDELPRYYALAKALVLPSISEQWGLVVNEAMASGLPVIVSNRCGCVEDLVQEGKNGFTFDPFDVDSITKALVKITQSESALRKMGLKSRQIIQKWSPEIFSRKARLLADIALKTPTRKPTWIDFIILDYLSRKVMAGYKDQ